MKSTLKKQLQETKAMEKFNKGLALVKEEVEIANRGEFCTRTDVEYLSQGYKLINEFKEELEKLLKEC